MFKGLKIYWIVNIKTDKTRNNIYISEITGDNEI